MCFCPAGGAAASPNDEKDQCRTKPAGDRDHGYCTCTVLKLENVSVLRFKKNKTMNKFCFAPIHLFIHLLVLAPVSGHSRAGVDPSGQRVNVRVQRGRVTDSVAPPERQTTIYTYREFIVAD